MNAEVGNTKCINFTGSLYIRLAVIVSVGAVTGVKPQHQLHHLPTAALASTVPNRHGCIGVLLFVLLIKVIHLI